MSDKNCSFYYYPVLVTPLVFSISFYSTMVGFFYLLRPIYSILLVSITTDLVSSFTLYQYISFGRSYSSQLFVDNNQKLIGEENNRNNAKAKAIDDRLCNMFDIEGRFKKIFPLRPIFPLFAEKAKSERRRIQGERRQKAGGRENGARHT